MGDGVWANHNSRAGSEGDSLGYTERVNTVEIGGSERVPTPRSCPQSVGSFDYLDQLFKDGVVIDEQPVPIEHADHVVSDGISRQQRPSQLRREPKPRDGCRLGSAAILQQQEALSSVEWEAHQLEILWSAGCECSEVVVRSEHNTWSGRRARSAMRTEAITMEKYSSVPG